jgi:hypothetical protein
VKWSKEPILYTCPVVSLEGQMSAPNARRRGFSVAGAIVATAFLAAVPSSAVAATCGLASITLDLADVVFVGTMTAAAASEMQATFTVDEVWKGEIPAAVDVGGPAGQQWVNQSMTGAKYLVLATVAGGGLRVGEGCNWLYPWDPSMAASRPATAHPPQGNESAETGGPSPEAQSSGGGGGAWPEPLYLIGVAVLLVGASAFAFRRTRVPGE